MIHDASPSWSGFNYQGKIALYHTLALINLNPHQDWTKHALRLEHAEDFEILVDSKCVTIHQVKAYQKVNFSAYQNAALSMLLELYKNPTIHGYLHTWRQIVVEKGHTIQSSTCGLAA